MQHNFQNLFLLTNIKESKAVQPLTIKAAGKKRVTNQGNDESTF